MHGLPLYTPLTVTMPEGTISEQGRSLIASFIGSQRLQEGVWKEANPDTPYRYLPSLPDEWSWVWTVTGKADYVGTFTKRVSKYYHQTMKLKCPPEFLTELGNMARSHSSEAITYQFEFVDDIDWDDGDYGDGGSCWWSQYAAARSTLTGNGGGAIRFYDADGDGIGRAWIVPYEGFYFLFNGYGFTGDSTLIIARVMSQYLGVTYKKVSLSNYGTAYNTLYINNATGYAIGTSEQIEFVEAHDFEFEIECEETCYNCGDCIDGDGYTGADENVYCESCYNDNFSHCDDCGETHWHDDITHVENHGYYCDDCRDHKFIGCSECGDYRVPDEMTCADEECEHCYCKSCRSLALDFCTACQQWRMKDEFVDSLITVGKRICEGCRKE